MPSFRDRVKDTTTTTGTGSVTLSGTAPTGYQAFATAYATGTPFLYCIVGGAEWETGTGYLSTSTTLVRDANVMDGSSGPGVLVNFSAGTKDVFVTITSHWCEDVDVGTGLARSMGYALP
jgi:hypothetical protein